MNYQTNETSTIDFDLIRIILEGLSLNVRCILRDSIDRDNILHEHVIITLDKLVEKFTKEEND